MEALDILEKRIDSLSRTLVVLERVNDNKSSTDQISDAPINSTHEASENIVDSLNSANTLFNEAIKDRESIHKAVKRIDELEKYMDPNYLDEQQQAKSKEVYLNAIAPDLHLQFEQLMQIKNLEPTLGAEYFRNIPSECTDKLKQIDEDNNEFMQQSELIESTLISAVKRYGEIQNGIMDSLSAMNKRLEAVEEKLEARKRAELEKELKIKD